ncbi:hypothetical protein RSPO_c00990 [Ralstonia solanacearum Po82]|uniref:Uncharacterized protein n=1 Tax=Ralstonia solanacearum (strain Po82) TaxID=1031711 RepID=F6FZK4_RALS8|nr:hypothetical protein RSPO_c00990 [Ralstonia solanacearum Po82]
MNRIVNSGLCRKPVPCGDAVGAIVQRLASRRPPGRMALPYIMWVLPVFCGRPHPSGTKKNLFLFDPRRST